MPGYCPVLARSPHRAPVRYPYPYRFRDLPNRSIPQLNITYGTLPRCRLNTYGLDPGPGLITMTPTRAQHLVWDGPVDPVYYPTTLPEPHSQNTTPASCTVAGLTV